MHRESLLKLAQVRHMMEDAAVARRPRAIDKRWHYEGIVSHEMDGFNPSLRTVYYGARSALASWLEDPHGSARPHNEGDFLVKELLRAVHDYLHAWGYLLLAELAPELGLGSAPVTAANLERMCFLHLVTEAIAVAGLDYWYLSTFDLDEQVPIGTTVSGVGTLYRERHLAEYRSVCAGFDAQRPQFLVELCTFYCTGQFRGFGVAGLRRSPRTLSWLKNELRYAHAQRGHTREWLASLAAESIAASGGAWTDPLVVDQPWQRELMAEVAQRLWRKVKQDQQEDLSRFAGRLRGWADAPASPDFRFRNFNRSPAAAGDGPFLIGQYLLGFVHEGVDPEVRARVPALVAAPSLAGLRQLLDGQPKVPSTGDEPLALFVAA